MRVLFAFYPLFVAWNHGIALLSALCKQRGMETELCLLDNHDEVAEKIIGDRWDCICFSATTIHDYQRMLPSMSMAKRQGQTVFLGGTFARLGIEQPIADAICHGDGERLPDLLLDGDTGLFDKIQVWKDLDILPLPDYDLFADIPFDRGVSFLRGKKVFPYHSSRGCPHRCSFCQVQRQPRIVRIRKQVEADLTELEARYHPDVFFIGDELLPYYSQPWRESWGSFRHPFTAYIRPDITRPSLEWLIDRGLTGCAFGVECGDERIRNEVLHKWVDDGQLYSTVGTLRKHGVDFVPYFMTHFPGETFLARKRTHEMAETLGNAMVWKYEQSQGGRPDKWQPLPL